ncbi:bifunctional metallophosphatase/5'-nucleotidase [Subdoligranulum sp. AF14-43]|nr:bifunctional metallophosphatase/5'-nucleotidase [Subdoligranulum sp. AF14-43]
MERTFKIIYTSDTHGHIFPVNYAAGCGESSGLLNLAAQIDKNGNTLVLDGGDSLQGTPLVQYYLAHADEFPHHPVAEAFNAMGCDYFTLGNHDFNFGYDALRAYLCAMDGVCLCANVQDLGGALPLLPETVHTLKNGLRIGITGIVTDYVNVWEQPRNLKKLRITEAFDAARAACARLRPICDICVCIYHGGFEEDLHTGAVLSGSGENLACRIARELDFDLLLTGHQHMPVESVRIGGTFAVQPPANAGRYLQVEAAVRDGGAEFSARLLPVGGIHREQPYRRLLPLEQAAQRWLDEPVGHLEQAIPPEEKLRAALHGSAVAALFNQVQLSHTGADISCTSLGNEPAGLAASVTMRAITAAYLFSNTLVVLEITEEILRALLERCASYFTLENGTPRVSDAFLAPKVEHYNYDFFAGISYQFDLRQPVGRRLTRLSRLDGTPLGPGPLRLCTSNYRATGTGGYDALRTCPVLWRGSVEMPELVAEYVRANSPVSLPCNGRMEAIW